MASEIIEIPWRVEILLEERERYTFAQEEEIVPLNLPYHFQLNLLFSLLEIHCPIHPWANPRHTPLSPMRPEVKVCARTLARYHHWRFPRTCPSRTCPLSLACPLNLPIVVYRSSCV